MPRMKKSELREIIERGLESLTSQLCEYRGSHDKIEVNGNTISKDYRNYKFFTSRPHEEDDDWPDFTGIEEVYNIIQNKFNDIKKRIEIRICDSEKSWFTVSVTIK